MPAKTRTVRESAKLQALAYDDAVRDILRADGRFNLGDERRPDAVWEWDGVKWTRIPIDEHGGDEAPIIEVERELDLADAR